MLPVMALLLIVVQETAARCGCVTGKGFASLIREKFGARKTALAMVALLIANTAVTISEFAAGGIVRLFGKWWMRGHDPQTEGDLVNTAETMVLRVLSR